MEGNVEDAVKAKELAEQRFVEKDFLGAKNYALKAKSLYPEMEGISQMVTTYEVYIASEVKCNGETDYYSVLGLKPSADKETVKKQYRKMAVLLHPDKNKCMGADGAFKLVSEAWTCLSDRIKKSSYDVKRNKHMVSSVIQTATYAAGVPGVSNHSNLPTSHSRLDTFWTVCTNCRVQYEYLRKYINKRLSCKNCRGTFVAIETGAAPVNGSFPYCPWPYSPANGHGSNGYDTVTYVPASSPYYTGNGVSSFQSAHVYASNVSFQWGSLSGTSVTSSEAVYPTNGDSRSKAKMFTSGANGTNSMNNAAAHASPNVLSGYSGFGKRRGRPPKRQKVVVGSSFRNGNEERTLNFASEGTASNPTVFQHDPMVSNTNEPMSRQYPMAPAFDARKLLIEKARTEILKKLEEIRLATDVEVAMKRNSKFGNHAGEHEKSENAVFPSRILEAKSRPTSMTVPDPDFHDFDKDRSEECFKPKQIWAIYDEDDGMPRLYCLIRQVISMKPFQIQVSYLNSKTDSEFGTVKWVENGFTKSCGHFRAWNTDVIEQVNIFSHLLKGEKAGRGGCVRIFPKCGEIWALYRNWSSEWNRLTPVDVKHQYEMVEVLDNYSEELGVCITPLIKMAGFKTVYQRCPSKDGIRWIPRREMLRFSHQVPSWFLEGEPNNLPDHCWDLDPAATPDELLHIVEEAKA